MKRFKYLLAVITICLLASCGNSSSMQGYVTEKWQNTAVPVLNSTV